MTKNYCVLWFIGFLFLAASDLRAEVIVKGIVNGGQGREIELYIPVVINTHPRISYTEIINEQGNFSFSINIKENCWAFLQLGRYQRFALFLTDNEVIQVSFDAENPSESFAVSEQLADNNFVYHQLNMIRPDYSITRSWRRMLYPDTAYSQLMYYRQKEERRLDSLNDQFRISPEFYSILKTDIEYGYSALFLRASLTNRVKEDDPAADAAWHALASKLSGTLNTNDPEGFNSLAYRYLMVGLFEEVIFHVQGKTRSKFFNLTDDSVREIAVADKYNYFEYFFFSKLFSGKMEELLCADRILTSLYEGYLPNLELIYNHFKKRFPKSPYLPYMEDKMKRVRLIGRDLPVEGISFNSADKHRITRSWARMIEPFKGKVTLVDLWGTWCGPCRGQFHHMAALKERFRESDLQYLYIAWEQDKYPEERWKGMAKFFNLKGIHHIANIDLIKDIGKVCGVGENLSFPTYIILDKEGKVVVKDAFWPSDKEKLYGQIQAVLDGRLPSKRTD